MNKKILIALALSGAAVLGTWRLLTLQDPIEEVEETEHSSFIAMDEDEAIAHGVDITVSGPGVMIFELLARGKVILHPDRIAHILPKIAGVAKEIRKNKGDPVEAGEVIAVLESREMAETKALYLAAKEREKLAKTHYTREEYLRSKNVSSEQEFLDAEEGWQEAKIALQLAQQKLYALGLGDDDMEQTHLRFYEIRSPITGTVIDRDITFGEYVGETTPIYTIADLDKVWVELGVYPKDLSKIKEKQTATVFVTDLGQSQEGKVIYVSPIIDDETITASVLIELDNKDRTWKPGTFVMAKILTDQVPVALIVDKKSIQMIDGEPIMFIRTNEGFEKQAVQLGKSNENSVEVIAGLAPGTKYAASGTFILKADLGKNSVEHDD